MGSGFDITFQICKVLLIGDVFQIIFFDSVDSQIIDALHYVLERHLSYKRAWYSG